MCLPPTTAVDRRLEEMSRFVLHSAAKGLAIREVHPSNHKCSIWGSLQNTSGTMLAMFTTRGAAPMALNECPSLPAPRHISEIGGLEPALIVHELRLKSFDAAGNGTPTTEARHRRVSEEFSDFLKILCCRRPEVAEHSVPSTQDGGSSMHSIRQAAIPDPDIPPVALVLPAPPLQHKQIRKERNQAASELAEKVKELARSNAELEQFAFVASHDLQEPLRMIANYTQLLAERYTGKLDAQADRYIRYAADGAVRMQALIHDLMEFSRAGHPENGLKTTDCNWVVQRALQNLRVAIRDSGAVVTCHNLPVVMAHAIQLEQVFQNLIGNAIKFCTTKSPAIQISAETENNEWVFSVTDNGIDIAPENAQVIFAIFQRLHSRQEYAGNGIGLAICKKIVEQHGGKIWLEPQTTPGATFKFTWPAIFSKLSA
jgi:signal transduction histidine kinase